MFQTAEVRLQDHSE